MTSDKLCMNQLWRPTRVGCFSATKEIKRLLWKHRPRRRAATAICWTHDNMVLLLLCLRLSSSCTAPLQVNTRRGGRQPQRGKMSDDSSRDASVMFLAIVAGYSTAMAGKVIVDMNRRNKHFLLLLPTGNNSLLRWYGYLVRAGYFTLQIKRNKTNRINRKF